MTRFSLSLIALLALPAVAGAQQAEIFIPKGDDPIAAPTPPQPQNRLAACLANPDAANCTGLDLDPGGLALESATAGPSVSFETLVLDLDEKKVTVAPEPPAKPTDYTAPAKPVGKVALPSVAVTIEFDFDSASIRADQIGKMAALIDALNDPALAGTQYAVIGHTDAKGSETYNCDLSRRRAASVTAALQANYVPLTLYPVGFGEYVLKNTYDPRAPENRRVTFLRLPNDAGPALSTAGAVCAY